MIHSKSHDFSGKKFILKDGCEFHLEDWWDRVYGKSWMSSEGNPACLIYSVRVASNNLPLNNDVVYGKVDGLGMLIHQSELPNKIVETSNE